MSPKLSDQEFHELYCPLKNTNSALFLVACFSLLAIGHWRGLHKAPEHPSLVTLVFLIVVAAMLAKSLMAFTCFRELLIFGVVIVSVVTEEVESFLPSVFGQYTRTINYADFALLDFGLLVSLTMVIRSARTPKVEPNERLASIARQNNRNFLIALAVAIAIIALSPLIYFLPSRWLQWLAWITSH